MAKSSSDRIEHVGFFLVPGFALLSYACAVEALRAANALAGQTLYRWTHLTPDSRSAAASSGLQVPADAPLSAADALDTVIVCAGGNPSAFDHAGTFAWLRGLARRRCRLGGVSGGPWLLARAGVLGGHRVTLHWEHAAAFAEAFPDLDLRLSLFELDRSRLTCSGGTAALDMMHALIEQEHGPALAMAVSDWLMQTRIRDGAEPFRMDLQGRTGITSGAVLRAVSAMEEATETLLSRSDLAGLAGVSPRHLERLFRHALGRTPGEHYLRLRLERARLLLRQSDVPVLDIAVACGFSSASNFTRAYRRVWTHTPTAERQERRQEQRRGR